MSIRDTQKPWYHTAEVSFFLKNCSSFHMFHALNRFTHMYFAHPPRGTHPGGHSCV